MRSSNKYGDRVLGPNLSFLPSTLFRQTKYPNSQHWQNPRVLGIRNFRNLANENIFSVRKHQIIVGMRLSKKYGDWVLGPNLPIFRQTKYPNSQHWQNPRVVGIRNFRNLANENIFSVRKTPKYHGYAVIQKIWWPSTRLQLTIYIFFGRRNILIRNIDKIKREGEPLRTPYSGFRRVSLSHE